MDGFLSCVQKESQFGCMSGLEDTSVYLFWFDLIFMELGFYVVTEIMIESRSLLQLVGEPERQLWGDLGESVDQCIEHKIARKIICHEKKRKSSVSLTSFD